MGFKTKRTVMVLLAGIILTVAYVVIALGAKAPEATNLSAWAILILKFIGIGIGAMIILQIIFHVVYSVGVSIKEGIKKGVNGEDVDDEEIVSHINATVREDEMDKAVESRASRFGASCMGIGFIIALFVLANGLPTLWALHIQLGAVMAGALLEGIVSIFLYERGV